MEASIFNIIINTYGPHKLGVECMKNAWNIDSYFYFGLY